MGFARITGILIALAGIAFLFNQWRTVQGREITVGTVTELVPTSGSKGRTYKVRAQFSDHEGTSREYVSSWSSNPPAHAVGDVIKIMYEKDNPAKNASLSFGTRFGFAWILLGIGLFILWMSYGWQWGDQLIALCFPNTHE
ncbi:MAG: DUF3592 domain-containing protein [Pseudomonadota bacterium]